MTVRAKFVCRSVETSPSVQPPDDSLKVVKLEAVTSGSKENEEFFQWTPSASISLATVNAAASAQFVPGVEYYVDFTPATPVALPPSATNPTPNAQVARWICGRISAVELAHAP